MYLLNLWDFSSGDVPTFQRILDSAGFFLLFILFLSQDVQNDWSGQ